MAQPRRRFGYRRLQILLRRDGIEIDRKKTRCLYREEGRRSRVPNIVDDVTRECPAAVADISISGRRVVREVAPLIGERGTPKTSVSDNGTEPTSNAAPSWSGGAKVGWHHIAPGRPMQNGFGESFTGRMRDALLTETLFMTRGHAGDVVAGWLEDDDTERSHSSLGYAAPAAFAAGFTRQGAASLRVAEGYATQSLAPPAHTRNNTPRSLVPAG